MAYRFTNTDKWNDAWFSNLNQIEKLLFLYICDNCDVAGFIEVNYKRWEVDLGSKKSTLQGALKGLQKGIVISNDGECVFIINFVKHQKNLPLNEKNAAHRGIFKRFELYAYKFGIECIKGDIERGYQGAIKGLNSLIGIGNGKDISKEEECSITERATWKDDFEVYKMDLRAAYDECLGDKEWVEKQQHFNPGIDIKKSIGKACVNYWATEAGWKKKKAARINDIDWKRTFANAITLPSSKVYLPK
jgi:hypothetical protein